MSRNPRRFGWQYIGEQRPPFAIQPGPGQESVWDYPRPPRVEAEPREVVVRVGSHEIARSNDAVRVLETASPPTIYIPQQHVQQGVLISRPGNSACEWKGTARYWSLEVDGRVLHDAAWGYPAPLRPFEGLRDRVSFYPGRLDCTLDGERVRPQPGGFYGGWVTDEIVGPIKGAVGTGSW